jgi:fused signal recognition particle receptor
MFDVVDNAIKQDVDLLIADTSGRLHTNINLMKELEKVKQVFDKKMAGKYNEVLLVVDATQGQNVLQQARGFNKAVGITGIVLTKLDGTSKGGVVVSIVDELGIPIKFIGVGEKVDDLMVFNADEYVEALFPGN